MKKRDKVWRDDAIYGNYSVSDDGDVMNKRTGRVLKACKNSSGYNTVNLYNNGERTSISVHRLVAETFNGCDDPSMEVNHIDGNKNNNRPENLEWVTRGENETHAYRTGLKYGPKHKPVKVVESGEIFGSIKACARAIRGSEERINDCLEGRAPSHKGLTFQHANGDEINTIGIEETISSKFARSRTHRKPVRIVETGEVYESLTDCAKAIDGDSASISACLAGTHHTHRGYHFEEFRN